MISGNIIISLGMVSALSIGFRTAIKGRGTRCLFSGHCRGLSIGSQNFKLVISTIFIAIVIVAASYIARFTAKYLIIVEQ